MRIFPKTNYSLITSYTPDEITEILMRKSIDHSTFDIGRIQKMGSGLVFTTTFYRTYVNDWKWNNRVEIDETAAPDITVVVVPKENHSILHVSTELGHEQQSIFVVIAGVMIVLWCIILGGILMVNGDLQDLLFPTMMLVAVLVIIIPIMHLYVDLKNAQSRRFFMENLKARKYD
jgi:hypothetical protein